MRLPSSRKGRIFLALATLAAGCAIDGLLVEPNWIEVTHQSVPAAVGQTLKIAHLTDLHTSGLGFRERRLLRLLEREKPDLIVITGDSVPPSGSYEAEAPVLRALHAPLGVWLIRGNWENWHARRNEAEYYRANGVNFLLNRSAEIRPGVWLVGFDDTGFARGGTERALSGVPDGAYRIALFHAPLFFSGSAGRYDLALAGHSHGGQVRLPFWGPLWLPGGIGPYLEGWFRAGGSRMYVSRGIGTTLLPVRFACRPELSCGPARPQY